MFILAVVVCSWGCVESSVYERYPTRAACEAAAAKLPDGTFSMSGYIVHWRYPRCIKTEE